MKFKTVSDSRRSKWMIDNFGINGDGGTTTEFAFYDLLDETVPSYSGGYFEMVEFSNGAKALMMNSDKVVDVAVESNFYQGKMTRRAVSLAAWMVTVNKLCWYLYEKGNMDLSRKFADQYYKIQAVLVKDPEAAEIFAYAD